ncbi:transposase [Nostocoides japonicum T1-X7]|uniref:Transposase n=1 Tax=Nostocoides japonicum T1-X7 TaxID=1194083 RepID=A0A077LZE3_9MICO|nr:IS110 family transposase [Tetrasphaera japonica]CCH77901.1 transposase [Tetrasphaera japonica T1-X7]CCH78660.1 transposase [Tetrasphaera japonica T1-X7]CCH79018.1 transposase [Tetrasphaera japonica T1-X7]CCH79298.1 transposase [Tetrasphaera japonica T1-X7]CCH79530.1 transposase [Tetrasphaera japonica T1-X7]
MKSASNARSSEPSTGTGCLPEFAANDVTAGIDWARDDHAACIVDGRGRQAAATLTPHTSAGLRDLIGFLGRHGVGEVAIERPDGPVVDALLGAGLTVVVISPNQVKNLRGRYGSAGNKDDRFDAYVLADTLRTDRARLRPLVPDTQATTALRRACRARKDLVKHRVAAANQLRAHLRNILPGAVGLFKDIDSEISLAFLTRFDTQDRIDWLTPKRLGDWLAKQGYSGKVDPAVLHQRLLDAPRGATGEYAASQAAITASYVALLQTLVEQIKTLSTQIGHQLDTHADAHIFTSLPRSGTVRAARLLAEIGDCRARFPTPESLACLAGAAPSTRQSGKSRVVGFRWSCDKQLRDAVIDFAADSRHANPWAADLYNRARTRGHDHAHAARILARAWLTIIWHCWQDHLAYNPQNHQALQRLLKTQTEAA